MRLSGLPAIAMYPFSQVLGRDSFFCDKMRNAEVLVVDQQFFDVWTLQETEILALVADHAWLLSSLWAKFGFLHGDVSAGNLCSRYCAAQLKELRNDVKASIEARMKALEQ